MKKNNFLSIIRAHQVQIDGYKMHRWGGPNAFPSVITVFSAPNYCGSYRNKGAVILIENDKMNIKQYKDVEQPFHLPGGLDLFTWSLPFLADKIGEMIDYILMKNSLVTPKEINDGRGKSKSDFSTIISNLNAEKKEQDVQKFNKIKAKVLTMGRMALMLKNIKENKELIEQAKATLNVTKLPPGLLGNNSSELKNQVEHFIKNIKSDSANEAFPIKAHQKRHGEGK